MKILFINSGLGRGGKERQISELLRGIQRKVSISLIVLDNDLAYDVRNTSIQILTVNKEQRHNLLTHGRVFRFISEFKPDIIHYWDHLSFFLALEYRLFHKAILIDGSIRYAGYFRSPLFHRMLKRASFSLASGIVANSQAGLKLEGLQNCSKASVVYNGINSARFVLQKDQELVIPKLIQDSIKIVMCAGFRPAKDYSTLIQAAQIICDTYPQVQFLLIGDGPSKPSIMNSLTFRYEDQVLFLGLRDDVEQILLRCDIGVLLNNIIGHAEGCSNAIMEYMAAGLPVVATRAGGNPEIIIDGVTGFLVEGFDIKQVVEKLSLLVENVNLRKELGKSGKELVINKFALASMTTSYLTLYQELYDNQHG